MGPIKNHSVLDQDQALDLDSMDENPVQNSKVGPSLYSPLFMGFQERNLSIWSDHLMRRYLVRDFE